jgi:methylphosphotriester-DNA--protein-cysteine methyltransferase
MIYIDCHDPDDFKSQLSGVTADMLITGVMSRRWAYTRLTLDDIVLQRGDLGSGNVVNCQASPNGILIYFLMTSEGSSRLDGNELQKGSVILWPPNCYFTLAHSHPHRWQSLFVPGLQSALPCCSLSGGSLTGTPQSIFIDGGPGVINRILQASDAVLSSAGTSNRFEASPAARRARNVLFHHLQSLLGSGTRNRDRHGRGRPTVPRSMVIDACHRYLAEADLEDVSLQDMIEHSGVSDRTLRTIFHEIYGFGPARFLQLRQLNRVYRDLKEADPTCFSVTNILTRHGVWNFNHFGLRYRELYGETPSGTLHSP